MNSKERRKYIINILKEKSMPHKGHILAENLGVTRQIIVKDIAILRAEGYNIIATPDGYIISDNTQYKVSKIIAVSHSREEIRNELESIVKFGGTVENVIIEHQLYGEIRGMLMIKSLYDIENFINKQKKYNAEPLLMLTGGVHLHTITAENEDIIENIINELKSKKYLISD